MCGGKQPDRQTRPFLDIAFDSCYSSSSWPCSALTAAEFPGPVAATAVTLLLLPLLPLLLLLLPLLLFCAARSLTTLWVPATPELDSWRKRKEGGRGAEENGKRERYDTTEKAEKVND